MSFSDTDQAKLEFQQAINMTWFTNTFSLGQGTDGSTAAECRHMKGKFFTFRVRP